MGDEAEALSTEGGCDARILAKDRDSSKRGPDEAGDDAQESCLARPVGACQERHTGSLDGQVDVRQRPLGAEATTESLAYDG